MLEVHITNDIVCRHSAEHRCSWLASAQRIRRIYPWLAPEIDVLKETWQATHPVFRGESIPAADPPESYRTLVREYRHAVRKLRGCRDNRKLEALEQALLFWYRNCVRELGSELTERVKQTV